jgi:hypothetical protein
VKIKSDSLLPTGRLQLRRQEARKQSWVITPGPISVTGPQDHPIRFDISNGVVAPGQNPFKSIARREYSSGGRWIKKAGRQQIPGKPWQAI